MSGSAKRTGAQQKVAPPAIEGEALLNALPHPLLVIGDGLAIQYANTAAEDFFGMSAGVLCRNSLTEMVAFGSPLIALVEFPAHEGRESQVEVSTRRRITSVGED